MLSKHNFHDILQNNWNRKIRTQALWQRKKTTVLSRVGEQETSQFIKDAHETVA